MHINIPITNSFNKLLINNISKPPINVDNTTKDNNIKKQEIKDFSIDAGYGLKGEFEGNEYVIMKMDRDNFIIFPEYDDGEGGIQIPFSLSIYKNSLLDAINSYAQEKGVI